MNTDPTEQPAWSANVGATDHAPEFVLQRDGTVFRFRASSLMDIPRERLFGYHAAPGALQRLIPPWEPVAIVASDDSLEKGSEVTLEISLGKLSVHWHAVHGAYHPPVFFEDFQESGPFAYWHHRHEFFEIAEAAEGTGEAASGIDFAEVSGQAEVCGQTVPFASALVDRIEYRVGLGRLGAGLAGRAVGRRLESMFRYRHRVTRDDLMLFDRYDYPPRSIAVSGATGMVGRELCSLLGLAGHSVIQLVRDIGDATDQPRPAAESKSENGGSGGQGDDAPAKVAVWHSSDQAKRLEGVDAVVHLAGKPIADQRWTSDVKQQIRDSRVSKTRQLCESLAKLTNPPATFLCASAIGIYGDRGDQWLDEDSAAGEGFLAEVAKEWEEACRPAIEAGIRVVNLRFGMILSPRGGALKKLLLPANLGLAGRLGSGKQWCSWITIDDTIGAVYHALATPSLAGPVNVVAPNPVTNREFTETIGRVLRRPTLLPAPAFALRLALGEMADALLLASTRVRPGRLSETGYQFRFDNLELGLRHLLGR